MVYEPLPDSKCSKCQLPAVFITPIGMLCADHALSEMTLDEDSGPVRRQPSAAIGGQDDAKP